MAIGNMELRSAARLARVLLKRRLEVERTETNTG
jgi:hypothetical protein